MSDLVEKGEQKVLLARGHYPKTEETKTLWHKLCKETFQEYNSYNSNPKLIDKLARKVIELFTSQGGTFEGLDLSNQEDMKKALKKTKQMWLDERKKGKEKEGASSNEQLPLVAAMNDWSIPTTSRQDSVGLQQSPFAPTLQDSDRQAMTNPSQFWGTHSPASHSFASLPPAPHQLDQTHNMPPPDISSAIPFQLSLLLSNMGQHLELLSQENIELRTRLEMVERAIWQRKEPNKNDDNEMEPPTEPV
jgi:hypothetical protein